MNFCPKAAPGDHLTVSTHEFLENSLFCQCGKMQYANGGLVVRPKKIFNGTMHKADCAQVGATAVAGISATAVPGRPSSPSRR